MDAPAMLFKSQVFTQTSGSIGGQTFSRNRSGMYTRARATPVNPSTPQQIAVRGFMADLSNKWVNLLNAAQRAAWDVYALNVLIPNRLGEPINIGGIGHYNRSNVPRLQAGQSRIDTAPAIFDTGDFFPVTMASPSAATQDFLLNFAVLDAWVGEDDAFMFILTSRPQNQSINFFKGPYRLADFISGDLAVPPTSPFTSAVGFPFVATQQLFGQVRVSRADGRLSLLQRIGAFTVA